MFGFLLSYLTVTVKRVSIFLLSVWVGIIMALILNNTFLYKIEREGTIWIAIGSIGLSFGILGLWLKNRVTIICTAFVGAYFTIRPIGWYIGHWPNEFTIVKAVQYGLYKETPSEYYLYILLIILLTGFGISVQFKIYINEKRKHKMRH